MPSAHMTGAVERDRYYRSVRSNSGRSWTWPRPRRTAGLLSRLTPLLGVGGLPQPGGYPSVRAT